MELIKIIIINIVSLEFLIKNSWIENLTPDIAAAHLQDTGTCVSYYLIDCVYM